MESPRKKQERTSRSSRISAVLKNPLKYLPHHLLLSGRLILICYSICPRLDNYPAASRFKCEQFFFFFGLPSDCPRFTSIKCCGPNKGIQQISRTKPALHPCCDLHSDSWTHLPSLAVTILCKYLYSSTTSSVFDINGSL